MTIGGSSSTPQALRSSRLSSSARTGSSASSKRTANSSTAASSPGGSTIAAARRTISESVIRSGSVAMPPVLPEIDDRANPVLRVHQVKALVDLVERDPVRDERGHIDVAVERALDELGDLVAALDAAEGGAADAPAGDQVARDDVQRLPLAGHARDRAQAPAH